MNAIENALTIDVEDYFQVAALAEAVRREDWHSMEYRVEANTHRLLELLDRHNTRATFFTLGWVAEKSPQLVRDIQKAGHEVASHGYSHQLIYNQTPEVFREETRRSKQILEDITGEPITGYLAHPKGETDDLPAILVVHEWWGLNDNIRAMTRRLAGEGYMALAVDMYDGEVAETPEAARKIMSKVMRNKEGALTNISAARRWLEREHSPTKMGIIGWCFGGGWALRGALNMKDNVDAVVMYYGEVITDESQLADLDAPLLGIFGAEDQGIPPENVREFEASLDELDKPADINIYEGAGHAFANPSGQNYDKEAAEKAWAKTTAFFERHLQE
jgi:carboxymethylenebutenolidase